MEGDGKREKEGEIQSVYEASVTKDIRLCCVVMRQIGPQVVYHHILHPGQYAKKQHDWLFTLIKQIKGTDIIAGVGVLDGGPTVSSSAFRNLSKVSFGNNAF